jgi:hypothetical protein
MDVVDLLTALLLWSVGWCLVGTNKIKLSSNLCSAVCADVVL